jgi:hypothetical protein
VEALPGRLSEAQVVDLYTKLRLVYACGLLSSLNCICRDHPETTDDMIISEFNLTKDMVPVLRSMYRIASLERDDNDPTFNHAI